MNKIFLLVVASAALLAGCTTDNIAPSASGDGADGLISLSSQVLQGDTNQTKAPINGNPAIDIPALDLYFARADENSSGIYDSYGNVAFKATRAAGKGVDPMQITWAAGSEQYYQVNNRKTKLTAWHPGGATVIEDASGKGFYLASAQRVMWTMDGAQDIMTAAAKDGRKYREQTIENMLFEHRLSQVQVYVYAEDAAAASAWGKITKASINDQRALCSYDLKTDEATGAVTFKGSASANFKVYDNTTGVTAPLTKTNAALLGTVMIEPQEASYSLKLSVTTAVGGTQDITLTGQALEASKAYKLYLKLERTAIAPSAMITAWKTPVNKDITVGDNNLIKLPAIGDVIDGAIVFWIDPDDPTRYKALSLTQSGTGFKWAQKQTTIIGKIAQSFTDGKGNCVAIKAYSENNTTNSDVNKQTTGDFSIDYPAANYCHEAGSSWYFPARNELLTFQRVYHANKTLFDANISSNGGDPINNVEIWSSSENPGNAKTSYYVTLYSRDWYDGRLKNDGRSYVRCMRETSILPAIGDFRNNGIVYWIDPNNPTKYKVFSPDQGSNLTWSTDGQTYVLGVNGQSVTDGRKNVDAMKAYSIAHTGDSNSATQTTGVFATDFPAAGFCDAKNTSDVTGWYLPAKDEMVALYTAYMANKTVFEATIKANKGTTINSFDYYWSSSEYDNTYSWNVSDGKPNNNNRKSIYNQVRCVREL